MNYAFFIFVDTIMWLQSDFGMLLLCDLHWVDSILEWQTAEGSQGWEGQPATGPEGKE